MGTDAGYGPYGEELKIETKSGKPSHPDNLKADEDSSNLAIEWSQGGTEKITKYEIRVYFTNKSV